MTEYPLSLDTLTQAGLVPDWQTVYAGWRGFRCQWLEWRLLAADVQQFAADSLSGDADADYLLVRVLDAEPSDVGLEREDAALRELAARSGVHNVTARRKWRYVAALTVPLTLPSLRPDEADDPYADAAYNWYSAADDFCRNWHCVAPEFPMPLMDEFEAPPLRYIARFREWLAAEETALKP